ncbi:MAG: hypothetical protein KC729_05655 [Candidatus Eisenbacteria bacterium]|uniref:HAMP domain-containing protein n=1 Tax=Eiseniibacteriota bacterium TaxID=2212470 RepID=A0A956RNW0_UNCEI|nr:hypothetical protein [Candidatus Eisenbacteria bacterium]MCA9774357.1 hypothetical protein [Myxococcales bacterium]
MAIQNERYVELRRDFLFSAGVLVAMNMILAFGAIGLFVRMGPVIDKILKENVYSLEAAEEMLAVLSRSAGEEVSDADRIRFERALDRAATNVTEPEESPIIAEITKTRTRALSGDHAALGVIVGQISDLVRINRQAMRDVDSEARRLGSAGAWSAVFLAFFSFLLTLWGVRRLRRRVIAPMVDIYDVLESVRRGDVHRRCRANAGPVEIQRLASSINLLLDGGMEGLRPEEEDRPVDAARGALVMMLEERSAPTILVDAEGNIVATNSSALDVLNGSTGAEIRHAIARLPEEKKAEPATEPPSTNEDGKSTRFETVHLPGHAGWLLSMTA